MRTLLLLLFAGILTFGLPTTTQAQSPTQKEKIEAMKVQFITEKLALTAEEAKLFWPIFDAYEADKKALRQKYRPSKTKIKLEELTDEQAQQLIDNQINLRTEELALLKKYTEQFQAILPTKKVAMLSIIERRFKQHLLRMARG